MSEIAQTGAATPFFIVSDVPASLGHYCDGLGFTCQFSAPAQEPFFALVGRGDAQIMLKDVGVAPIPNASRHADAPWDAFSPQPRGWASKPTAGTVGWWLHAP